MRLKLIFKIKYYQSFSLDLKSNWLIHTDYLTQSNNLVGNDTAEIYFDLKD